MGTGETSLLQGNDAFQWLESLCQMKMNGGGPARGGGNVNTNMNNQRQPHIPDFEPVSLAGSTLAGNFSDS